MTFSCTVYNFCVNWDLISRLTDTKCLFKILSYIFIYRVLLIKIT